MQPYLLLHYFSNFTKNGVCICEVVKTYHEQFGMALQLPGLCLTAPIAFTFYTSEAEETQLKEYVWKHNNAHV